MSIPDNWRIYPVGWASHAKTLAAIRHAVFVVEQQVPVDLELDELDPHCYHVLLETPEGQGVGTGRLLPDGHIGRVAILPEHRGLGLGKHLMAALLNLAREQGMPEVLLNAQVPVQAFYEGLGFIPEGEVFMEAGIPHRAMRLCLKEPQS